MSTQVTHEDAVLVYVDEMGESPDALFRVLLGRGPWGVQRWSHPEVKVVVDQTLSASEFSKLVDDWTIVARNQMSYALALVGSAELLQRRAKKIKRGPTADQLAARATEYFDAEEFLDAEREKSPYEALLDKLGD